MADLSDLLLDEDPGAAAKAMSAALRKRQGLGELRQDVGTSMGDNRIFNGAGVAQQGAGDLERVQHQQDAMQSGLAKRLELTMQQAQANRAQQELKLQGERFKAEQEHRAFGEGLQGSEFQHKRQQDLDAKVRELGKEMEPLHAVDTTLTQLEDALARNKGALPGVGPARGNLPPGLITEEGKKLRSLVETVGLQGDRVISGSTGFGKSPEMAAKLQGATQLLKTGTDQGIRQGAALMRQLHKATKAATLQSYDPAVQQVYLGRGNGHSAKAAPAEPVIPNGAVKAQRHKGTGAIRYLDASGNEVK